MTEVAIESDVPMSRASANKRYNFEAMRIGDSMFFERISEVESAQSASKGYAARHNKTFKTSRRKVEGGYRLWRIA